MDAVKIPRGTAKQAVAPRNLAPGQFFKATMHANEIYIEGLQKFDKCLAQPSSSRMCSTIKSFPASLQAASVA